MAPGPTSTQTRNIWRIGWADFGLWTGLPTEGLGFINPTATAAAQATATAQAQQSAAAQATATAIAQLTATPTPSTPPVYVATPLQPADNQNATATFSFNIAAPPSESISAAAWNLRWTNTTTGVSQVVPGSMAFGSPAPTVLASQLERELA